jgi:hypothetical protein
MYYIHNSELLRSILTLNVTPLHITNDMQYNEININVDVMRYMEYAKNIPYLLTSFSPLIGLQKSLKIPKW